jgi:hypothetical protein
MGYNLASPVLGMGVEISIIGYVDRAGAFFSFLGGLGAPALPHMVISFAYSTTAPAEAVLPRANKNTNGLFIYFFIYSQ